MRKETKNFLVEQATAALTDEAGNMRTGPNCIQKSFPKFWIAICFERLRRVTLEPAFTKSVDYLKHADRCAVRGAYFGASLMQSR